MKEALAIAALLATIGAAGGTVALAHPNHHKSLRTIQSSGQQLAGAASRSTALSGRPFEDRGKASPFGFCQHLDPTTPAVRIGPSECLPLPY
jgi:hypothetical protein